jgi:outer membrane lipoprotein LolB
MLKLPHILIYLLFPLYLIGCSSVPEEPDTVEWKAHKSELKQLTGYTATGKLGYIAPDQRHSLNFYWAHSSNFSQIRLSTFLGQTVFNLTSTPNGAVVETYDGEKLAGDSANILITELTGLDIPIEQLESWLIGMPTSSDRYSLNRFNTVENLTTKVGGQTWSLLYKEYLNTELSPLDQTAEPKSLPLPSRMQLTEGDTKINLVVSKWIVK